MRTMIFAVLVGAPLALAGATASADDLPPLKPKQQPLVLEKEQLGTQSFAGTARARMRDGDCAGALEVFDLAIGHSIDPSLRRDRGICHEQLGQPYPAIDDYRAYLTDAPDAPDAENIRARLARLEQQTLGHSSASRDDQDVPPAGGAGASASISIGSGGVSASTSASKPRDSMDYIDRNDDALRSPLRRGTGFSVTPLLAVHKWFAQGSSFGDAQTWAEALGLALRYSVSSSGTVFLEGAYQRFDATGTSAGIASIQGLTSQIGYELRLALDDAYDNQLLLAPGLGFESWTLTTNIASASSTSLGGLVPRVRLGWRHMLAASAAVDLSLDAGAGKVVPYSDFPFGGSGSAAMMAGANVGLAWGL